MSPLQIELIKTMHEDQRRRLSKRVDRDARTSRPTRRKPRI